MKHPKLELVELRKEVDVVIANKPVTPRAQYNLHQLIEGALKINKIHHERYLTPAELALQQEWLEAALHELRTNWRYNDND